MNALKELEMLPLPDGNIDLKIRPLVRALNESEKPTYASCAGHTNLTSHEHPWVGIWYSKEGARELAKSLVEHNRQSSVKWELKFEHNIVVDTGGVEEDGDGWWLKPEKTLVTCIVCMSSDAMGDASTTSTSFNIAKWKEISAAGRIEGATVEEKAGISAKRAISESNQVEAALRFEYGINILSQHYCDYDNYILPRDSADVVIAPAKKYFGFRIRIALESSDYESALTGYHLLGGLASSAGDEHLLDECRYAHREISKSYDVHEKRLEAQQESGETLAALLHSHRK